ncbi:glycerophosphodiester phosphodiesterase family protein [Phnomibacter sp.]|uniref:glycerophosphodiester phosphodiesterase family protein n=1 Tax=Phnomibacter sp. TaxID=2836217 RepID=UPI002FDEA8F6
MMRRGLYGLLFLAVLTLGCSSSRKSSNTPADFFQYQPGKAAAISAHRGGGDYKGYPENCIESFAWLAAQMPVTIECDISMSKDSVLLMMHDDSYNRTTTGSGKISDSLFAYSQTLLLKDNMGNLTNFRIPTLEQVLAWGSNKVTYTLDVKRSVPFEKVVALVQQYKAHRYAAIITYNAQDAAKVHQLDKDVMISVTIRNEEEYNRHKALGIPDNRMIAFVGTREPNSVWLQTLHSKGIRCILGTLGNLDKMAAAKSDTLYQTWYKAGADMMSTDRPLEAWKALQQ